MMRGLRSLSLLLGLLVLSLPAEAAIAFVKDCTGGTCTAGSGTNQGTIAFGSNVTAGNLIVIGVLLNDNTVAVSSVVGCSSEAGAVAKRQVNNTQGTSAEIVYVANTAGGCTNFVVNLDGTTTFVLFAMEFSGAATSSVVDQTDGANQTSGATAHPASGTTMTPSVDGTVVVSVSRIAGSAASGTPATNFTEAYEFGGLLVYVQYWIQTTATATDGSWTSNVNDTAVNAMTNFKPPAAVVSACRGTLLGVGCDASQ